MSATNSENGPRHTNQKQSQPDFGLIGPPPVLISMASLQQSPAANQKYVTSETNNSSTAIDSNAVVTSSPSSPTLFDPSALTENERVQLRHTILNHVNRAVRHFNRLRIMWLVIYYILSIVGIGSNVLVMILSGIATNTTLFNSSSSPASPSTVPSTVVAAADTTTSIPGTIPTAASLLPAGTTTATMDSSTLANNANITSNSVLNASTVATVIAILSAVSTVSVALNGQLQTHMNAVYFAEAKERWQAVEMQVWTDLAGAYQMIGKLEQIYDKSGVGPLVNFGNITGMWKVNSASNSGDGGFASKKVGIKNDVVHKKRHAYPGRITDLE